MTLLLRRRAGDCADLTRAFEAFEPWRIALPTHQLLARLEAVEPRRYGRWLSRDLADLLSRHGVVEARLWPRGSARQDTFGVLRADVEAAAARCSR